MHSVIGIDIGAPPALVFALANVWSDLGQPGKAVPLYRRAHAVAPRRAAERVTARSRQDRTRPRTCAALARATPDGRRARKCPGTAAL